ncbi:MAG: metallophosphoesterase [Oscillospiraceae bacterium]|nr:metallophosphoesterase [Oscillospiraceae bacterium]
MKLLKNWTWRKIIRATLIVFLIIAAIHIIHALTLDRILQYKEVSLYSQNLPPEMDGYRVAFIADTHILSDSRLRGIVDELNSRDIDLLLLGGDMSVGGHVPEGKFETFTEIATTDGMFGISGNHDWYPRLFEAYIVNGIMPLANSGLHVRENFYLAGVEDLWGGNPCIETAIADATADDFVLLLSHNPDVAMQQDTSDVDLILSGHTHGGQITFFCVWAPYFTLRRHITEYGQRFRAGWAQSRDGTPVLVSRGAGEYLPRVFARPQVVIVTLRHGE